MRWALVLLVSGALVVQLQTASVWATPAHKDSGFAARVLDLTNGERQQAGLETLVLSSELTDAAQKYSQVLATSGCFEHTCGLVPNFVDRVGQSGYAGWTALAENIAAGYPTPETVVAGWMSSPGHRANILSPKYTEMGIGVVSGTGYLGTYWTQEFGSRAGVAADQAPAQPAVDQAPPAPTDDSGAADDGGAAEEDDSGG